MPPYIAIELAYNIQKFEHKTSWIIFLYLIKFSHSSDFLLISALQDKQVINKSKVYVNVTHRVPIISSFSLGSFFKVSEYDEYSRFISKFIIGNTKNYFYF